MSGPRAVLLDKTLRPSAPEFDLRFALLDVECAFRAGGEDVPSSELDAATLLPLDLLSTGSTFQGSCRGILLVSSAHEGCV